MILDVVYADSKQTHGNNATKFVLLNELEVLLDPACDPRSLSVAAAALSAPDESSFVLHMALTGHLKSHPPFSHIAL